MSWCRWFVPIVLALALVCCASPAPHEEQVRARIDEMTTALAEGNVRQFMAPVADDFTGISRNLDQRGARLLLHRELKARERLRARVFDIEVEVHGDSRATATMHVVLTGGRGLVPDSGRWYRVRSGWRLDGSDWMLVSASWENVVGR